MAPNFIKGLRETGTKALGLNLPTLLGLSALFGKEIAEFTNLSEYQK